MQVIKIVLPIWYGSLFVCTKSPGHSFMQGMALLMQQQAHINGNATSPAALAAQQHLQRHRQQKGSGGGKGGGGAHHIRHKGIVSKLWSNVRIKGTRNHHSQEGAGGKQE